MLNYKDFLRMRKLEKRFPCVCLQHSRLSRFFGDDFFLLNSMQVDSLVCTGVETESSRLTAPSFSMNVTKKKMLLGTF